MSDSDIFDELTADTEDGDGFAETMREDYKKMFGKPPVSVAALESTEEDDE